MRTMRRILIAPLLLVSLLSLRAQMNYGRIQTGRIANQQTGIITGTAPDASRVGVGSTISLACMLSINRTPVGDSSIIA